MQALPLFGHHWRGKSFLLLHYQTPPIPTIQPATTIYVTINTFHWHCPDWPLQYLSAMMVICQ